MNDDLNDNLIQRLHFASEETGSPEQQPSGSGSNLVAALGSECGVPEFPGRHWRFGGVGESALFMTVGEDRDCAF